MSQHATSPFRPLPPEDAARAPQTPPPDPLAAALPAWDLVPATEFLRRR